jgi:hypothetical protein
MNIRVLGLVVVAACGSSSESPPPTPKPIPLPAVAPAPPPKPDIERRLYPTEVTASSFLEANTRPYVQYHPNFAADADTTTAWNEGAPGDGPGEWLRFAVTPQQGVSRIRLRVSNGFQFNDAIYKANPRAKTIEITPLPGGKPHRHVLTDDQAPQEIIIPTELPALQAIELKIVDVYPGSRFKDLAISEVEIYVTSKTPERPDIEKANLAAILDWKQHQLDLASVPGIFTVGDPIEMPAEAGPFLEAARQASLAAPEVTITTANDPIGTDPGALVSCIGAGQFDSNCLADLYTTKGLKLAHSSSKNNLHECHPWLHGKREPDGSIGELVVSYCVNSPSRMGAEYHEEVGVALEYDDDGHLRAIVAPTQFTYPEGRTIPHALYLEWGKLNGGQQVVVKGAWTDKANADAPEVVHALIRADK